MQDILIEYSKEGTPILSLDGEIKVDTYKCINKNSKLYKGCRYSFVGEMCRLDPTLKSNSYQEFLKKSQQKYGKTVWKRWDKLMNREWLQPIQPVKELFLYRNTKALDVYVVQEMRKRLPVINQVVEDRQENLVHICAVTGKLPQELKPILGKSLWKSLCNNSKTRNILISQQLCKIGIYDRKLDDLKFELLSLQNTPSTLLKKGITLPCMKCAKDILNIKKYKDITKQDIHYICDLFCDTKSMFDQEGMEFNFDWSYKRLKEEHDKVSEIILLRQYTKDKFKCIIDNPTLYINELVSECGKYKACILDSPYALKEEGNSMKHCIGSYVYRVESMDCIMYSIRDIETDERISSLQINLQTTPIRAGQHYGYANSKISNEAVIKLKNELVEKYGQIRGDYSETND